MSEEEKKAIKLMEICMFGTEELTIIKNLIEKKQKEIEDLKVIADDIKDHRIVYVDTPEFEEKFIAKDKIKEKIEKYREKLERLHSQELWNEPEDSIKDFKYNHYLEAYKELL